MMDSKLDEIVVSLSELKITQNKLINASNEQGKTLKTFTKTLDDLNSKFDNLETKLSKLEAANSQLKSCFDLLEKDYGDYASFKLKSNSPAFEIELLNEIYDRQSRANNIIVFNLPELNSENTNSLSDLSRLNDLFNDTGLNLQIAKAHRHGKPTFNSHRPIKVTLPNASDTFSILRSQNKLQGSQKWSDIRFSSYRSTKQREFMSNLLELSNRREKGEKDIIIKNIKGSPTIVHSKN